ncbi:MAG: glycosyltransferase family 4 protein [Patescibacteria group bacterium]
MKVLFVSALLPYPLYSGGQVRIYNLLSRLSKHHEITLVTFLRNLSEKQYEKDLSFCKKIITAYRGSAWQANYVIRSVLGIRPLLLSSYDLAELRRKIARELETGAYDLVHIEPWYVWPCLPKIAIPIVTATHNIEYAVYTEYVRRFRFSLLRPGYYWDVLKLMFWEKYVWKKARHVIAVSEDDARVIRKSRRAARSVTVVPNGVDVDSFRSVTKKIGDHPVFLFVGSFNWMQNRDAVSWLVTSIWPKIQKIYPGSTLRIVGRSMPDPLRKLVHDRQAILLEEVTNIEEEFQKADVLLAPIRIGGGTSFKILEAMASGLPVVTTTLGATGLNVTHNKELCIGNTEDEFIAAVAGFIKSPKKRNEITINARKTIEREYAWGTIARALDRVWYETAKRII